MADKVKSFYALIVTENLSKFPHEIKSEKYWRHIVGTDKFAGDVLDTIMKKQGGRASDRQIQILRRLENGETSPYSTKN